MRQEARSFYRLKNKGWEETNRKDLIGWGHTANRVWGKKAQSWFGVWGLADWMDCVSGQAKHLQGQKVT